MNTKLNFAEPLDAVLQDELLKEYKANPDNRDARNMLIEHNLRLVWWVAQKLHRNGKTELEDLFQQGVLGLIRAITKYDPDRGANFSTIAVWCIKSSISRNRLEINTDASLDAPIGEEEFSLADTIIDETAQPEAEAISNAYVDGILTEFKPPKLKKQEFDFIKKNYGLRCKEQSLVEIAKECGLEAHEVTRIRNRGLAKMRKVLFLREARARVDEQTSYYSSPDYTQPHRKNRDNTSPVERIVLQRESMLNRIIKERRNQ